MKEGALIVGKTLLVTAGLAMFVLGAVETIMTLRGESDALGLGLGLLAAGAAALGIPIGFAMRDAIREAKKEGRF